MANSRRGLGNGVTELSYRGTGLDESDGRGGASDGLAIYANYKAPEAENFCDWELLDRLEAENAELRERAAKLALEIHVMRYERSH